MDNNQNIKQNNDYDPNTEHDDEVAEKISQEFKINLPGEHLPLAARLIAFFTLIGGLSIIGSVFVDVIRPTEDMFSFILRILAGAMAILISYGIIEHKRWSIWLYGVFTLLVLISNPFFSVIPLAAMIYLFVKREYFNPSVADLMIAEKVNDLKSKIRGNKNANPPQS